MPRRPRISTGGYVFHVLNRAVGRQTIFAHDSDFDAFVHLIEEAQRESSMRILAYVVMPNHWHFVLWPQCDNDLANYMHWLTLAHTQRWHRRNDTVGTGPIYQGRFKSFPVETDDHFLQVCRYAERNPLRANLVRRAEAWRWSSLWQRENERCEVSLGAWPVPCPSCWIDYVNGVETETELRALRNSVLRGAPFGNTEWRLQAAAKLGLEKTVRLRGRPRV